MPFESRGTLHHQPKFFQSWRLSLGSSISQFKRQCGIFRLFWSELLRQLHIAGAQGQIEGAPVSTCFPRLKVRKRVNRSRYCRFHNKHPTKN